MVAAGRPKVVETPAGPLYASRVRIYPRGVSGFYRNIKWAVLALCLAVYYVTPWIRFDRGPGAPDQAVLLDITNARGYFFWIEIWPQEIYYLTGLLLIGAVGLFLVSSLFGRLWCGYTCPQTVWTDLFMLVERWIEGERHQRMRLDRAPLSAAKFARKSAKHAAWLLISLTTGGAWIFYFNDAPTTMVEVLTGQSSLKLYFFVGLFTATTYVLAGFAREQVCTYMCPWPRFQAAMLDEQTLTVTYQAWRGEPRGKHKQGDSWEGRGDCVDCRACIAVCPTGIDIRDGMQLECIGCGLCIDACNDIMGKVGRPRELITFATLASQAERAKGHEAPYRLVRPRTIIYATMLAVVAGAMLAALLMRADVTLTVIRDRLPLFVTLSDGSIRNGYTLKIGNKAHEEREFRVRFDGAAAAGAEISLGEAAGVSGESVAVRADSVGTVRVYARLERAAVKAESLPVDIVLLDRTGREVARERTVFRGPAGRP
ncbi:MAG: cytochrome c oxidase accessory protein CcoG [Alphaproteobacteria bacterium]|nr:cytochrome c oxidase accessory protein CcoG [Alphaproteobacteria bacterium]